MELHRIEIVDSPMGGGRLRLQGEVHYDAGAWGPEWMWFDVPQSVGDSLSDSGNPWLVALVPLAVTLGEPLRICAPVDRQLVEGIQHLMMTWRTWYSSYPVVPLEVDLLPDNGTELPPKTVSLFSGGVDSFYTALRNQPDADTVRKQRIDDLLLIWGMDIPIANEESFRNKRDRMRAVADEFGKQLVDVATNLRSTHWDRAHFTKIAHGGLLAGAGLALEKRYRKVLIASSISYHSLVPWASHPFTDRLMNPTCR